MYIYYQWEKGAYSHIASNMIENDLTHKADDILSVPDFLDVWEKIWDWNIGVLPIENSYAGSVHENVYNFLRYDYKIIGELNMDINHCILSNEKQLSDIKRVFAHPQALSQCYNYMKKNNLEPMGFSNNGAAAKMVAESWKSQIAAIAASYNAELYGLNILDEWIQDQQWNKTRFFLVASKDTDIEYKEKKDKITILFEARNIPASLYKCLGAFATNDINLTKIESIPSLKNPFTYMFWVDFQGKLEDEWVKNALAELEFFTNDIKVLGEY